MTSISHNFPSFHCGRFQKQGSTELPSLDLFTDISSVVSEEINYSCTSFPGIENPFVNNRAESSDDESDWDMEDGRNAFDIFT